MADTTIQVKSPSGWKIKLILTAGALIVITILAFVYRFEFGIIALAIGLGYAAKIAIQARHQFKLNQYEQRRLEAEIKKLEASSFFVETNTGVFFLENSFVSINSFYPAVSASKLLADVPTMSSVPETPKYRKFLDVSWTHLLVVGKTNVGKSTLMCHVIDHSAAQAYIVDPHTTQNRLNGLHWPPHAGIIGDGRDWAAVDAFLLDMLEEMNRRYKASANLQPILIVADEWLGILRNCDHAERFFEEIGSEARKVRMSLVIGTVSQTVDDLKVSAAVRDNLTQITLNESLKSQNLGLVRWAKGDTELVELPGPYYGRPALAAPIVTDSTVLPPEDTEPLPELDPGPYFTPSQDELRIYELYLAGKSLRGIYQAINGGNSGKTFGGKQANEIKETLAKFNVIL